MPNKSKNNFSALEKFIQSQKIIRVLIDGYGANVGNQVASINVMKRLRQIGFNGIFEVVYWECPDEVMYSCKNGQLFTLLDLPANTTKTFFDSAQKIIFYDIESFLQKIITHEIEPVTLGFTGAIEWRKPSSHYADLARQPLNNWADFLNVNCFIHLSPEARDTNIVLKDSSALLRYVQYGTHATTLIFPVVTLADAKNHLTSNFENVNLRFLLDVIATEKSDFMPVYGWSIRDSYFYNPSHRNLINLILGACHARLHQNDLNKPLILGLFFNLPADEYKKIIDIVQANDYENSSLDVEIIDAIRELAFACKVRFTRLSEFSSELFKTLSSGQLLVLLLEGLLPKKVFDGLYFHEGSNMWPSVFEGANTHNQLKITNKTPPLHCQGQGIWQINLTTASQHVRQQVIALDRFFCKGSDSELALPYYGYANDSEPNLQQSVPTHELVGNWILDALNSTSPLSQFFAALHQQYLNPNKDRIVLALTAAKDMVSESATKTDLSYPVIPTISCKGMPCEIRVEAGVVKVTDFEAPSAIYLMPTKPGDAVICRQEGTAAVLIAGDSKVIVEDTTCQQFEQISLQTSTLAAAKTAAFYSSIGGFAGGFLEGVGMRAGDAVEVGDNINKDMAIASASFPMIVISTVASDVCKAFGITSTKALIISFGFSVITEIVEAALTKDISLVTTVVTPIVTSATLVIVSAVTKPALHKLTSNIVQYCGSFWATKKSATMNEIATANLSNRPTVAQSPIYNV